LVYSIKVKRIVQIHLDIRLLVEFLHGISETKLGDRWIDLAAEELVVRFISELSLSINFV